MKELLMAEMKRALVLLEQGHEPINYGFSEFKEVAELKKLLSAIRRHSILLEKESKY